MQTFGLLYTTSSKAGFLTGLSIVISQSYPLSFKTKATIFIVLGIVVATTGLYLLTAADSFQLNIGDILVLGCAVAFAAHILINGFSKKISPLLLSTSQVLAVGIFSSICAFCLKIGKSYFQYHYGRINPFIRTLSNCPVCNIYCFFHSNIGTKHTSPTRVAIIFAMEPVFAALTGVLVANEQLSISAIIGCLCIFLGMIFVELPSKTKEAQVA